jgi:hypothetical protein
MKRRTNEAILNIPDFKNMNEASKLRLNTPKNGNISIAINPPEPTNKSNIASNSGLAMTGIKKSTLKKFMKSKKKENKLKGAVENDVSHR